MAEEIKGMMGNVSGIGNDTWSALDYRMSELDYWMSELEGILQTIQTTQTNDFIFYMEEIMPRVDKIKGLDVYNVINLFIIKLQDT